MFNAVDMVRKPKYAEHTDIQKGESPVSDIGSIRFSPVSCVPKPSRRPWYIAFLVSAVAGVIFAALFLPYTYLRATTVAPVVLLQVGTSTSPDSFTYGPKVQLSQTDFFATTLASFKAQKVSFIEADLSLMKIRYYKDGEEVFEAPILTKGKEGSWWETPSGLYKVESKSANHFSSFGHVYTPWNMVFQGNFFIHGWPYYPDGTPVSTKYSGGCIRLADEDAKKLYDMVAPQTPVLVHEKDFSSDGFAYTTQGPVVDAKAYIIADIDSGSIIAQKGETQQLPIASLTKLMTALVASEYINLDKDFTVPESAMGTTSVPRLQAGMTMSGYSLLLPLLLESSNVAANTFASILGTDRFVQLMNQKAASLGMTHTVFVDASGAGAGNVSTVQDLLRLATYIRNNRSFVYKITTGEKVDTSYTVYNFGPLSNFNTVPGLTGFVGGKVGKTTAALETILSVYTITIDGQDRTIAFVVLGSNDNYKAVQELYAYMQLQHGVAKENTQVTSQ